MEAEYLRRMEELGYLPVESSKNAAREGAAENLGSKTAQKSKTAQRGGIRVGMTEAERYEVLKDRMIRVVTDTKSAAEKESIDKLSLIPRARTKAENVLIPLAERLGILNRNMKTPEVDIEFQFSKGKGLKESTHKQLHYGGSYADFAKALINIDAILENAVLIEMHPDKYKGTPRADQTLEGVSVLFGAFRDGKSVIPVQFEIKKSSSYGGRLHMYVTLAKIEADVTERASGLTATDPSLVSASVYKISDLIKKINAESKHFLKYLPDEMLTDLQKAAKKDALEEDRRRIDSYKKSEEKQ